MSKIYIKLNLNFKTGFFSTEAFILLIQDDALKLIPEKSKKNAIDNIIINFDSIKTISIYSELPVEIEIRTDKTTYIGTFPKLADISGLVSIFTHGLGKRFLYN